MLCGVSDGSWPVVVFRSALLFLSLGSFILAVSATPGVRRSDWQEKRTFILGEQWNVAEYRVNFDSSPHLLESVACPRLPCPPVNDTPPLCDYSRTFGECGQTPVGCNPEQLLLSCVGRGEESDSGEVIREPEWVMLEEGVPVFINTHPRNTFQNFRFYIDPVSEEEASEGDTCRALVIDISPFTGDPDIFIHNEPPAATITRNIDRQDNIFGGAIVVCPNDPAFRRGMTVYIGVYTFVLPAVYNIVASLAVLPPYVPVESCTEGAVYPCLTDGVPLETVAARAPYQYIPEVTGPGRDWKGEIVECPVVHIGITAADKEVNLRIEERDRSTNEILSEMSIEGNGFVAKDFALCSREGEILEDRMYLVRGWVSVAEEEETPPFTLLASTWVSAEVSQMVSLPPFAVMGLISNLGQDVRLRCPDYDFPRQLLFDGVVYAGVTGNAYNPLPTLSDNLLRDSFSTNPAWAREYFSDPNLLYAYFIFRYTIGNVPVIINVTDPGECSIDFSPALVGPNRARLVESSVQFESLSVTCNEDDFDVVSDDIRKELLSFSPIDPQNVTLASVFESVSYLDVIRYNNSWTNCERQMYQYFQITEPVVPVVLARDNYCENLPDWSVDQCCNGTLCCDPNELTLDVQSEILDNFQIEFAQNTCSEYDCTSLFLRDFSSERTFQSLGFCGNRVSSGSLRVFYLRCKQSLYNTPNKDGRSCSSDNDCNFQFLCEDGACMGLGRSCQTDADCKIESACNYFIGTCTGVAAEWEEMFLGCFIQNMTVSVADQIANIYEVAPLSTDFSGSDYLEYFADLRDVFMDSDCVSITGIGMDGLLFRNHTEVTTASTPGSSAEDCRCTEAIDRTYEFCLDRDCLLPPECLHGVYLPCLFLSREIRSSPVLCVNETICNWNDCSGLSPSDCNSVCTSGPNGDEFCGVCHSSQCVEIASRQTESGCLEGPPICLTTSGSYISDIPEEECAVTGGSCSVECGGEDTTQCTSRNSGGSVCFDPATTLDDCLASPLGGVWNEILGVCVYQLVNNSIECEQSGLVFQSCLRLDEGECSDCASGSPECPVRQDLLSCFISPRFPCTREGCEGSAGSCNDDVFINTQVDPFVYGACVLPFDALVLYSSRRLFCRNSLTVTQLGCVDYHILTAESCSFAGGKWTLPAGDSSDCAAHGSGCRTEESFVTGLFEDLSVSECLLCSGEYLSYFEWSSAEWIPGKSLVPSWGRRETLRPNVLAPSLSFPSMEAVVLASVEVDLVLNLEADALCITSKVIIDSLDVMSCACNPMTFSGSWLNLTDFTNVTREASESFTGVCADENNVDERTYGSVRSNLCPGEREFLLQASVLIECSEGCLQTSFFCVDLSMLPVSANELAVPTRETASLSFVETPSLTNEWSVVKNENGAEVGQLIGDGAVINVTGGLSPLGVGDDDDDPPVVLTRLCFEIRPDIAISPTFTVFDAGILQGGVLRPLYMNFTSVKIAFEAVCGSDIPLPFGSSEFFPIIRYEDAESRSAPDLKTGEKVVIYLSASFYTIALLSTVFQFSVPNVWRRNRLIINYVACAHVFFLYLIRSVYLFLLGSQVLPEDQEDIADYILIELPIFFYLGTFSLIGLSFLLWWLRARKGFEISPKMFWVAFGVWSLGIWIYFAVVITLINVLTEDDNEITRFCGSRLAKQTGENDARTIRIIYTSIILCLTLVIVFMNVYVGLDLAKESQSHTVYQSVWMSFGLTLTSLTFVIYYAIDSATPDVLIVLWFTEIIPTQLLMLMLSPRRVMKGIQKEKSAERKSVPIFNQREEF